MISQKPTDSPEKPRAAPGDNGPEQKQAPIQQEDRRQTQAKTKHQEESRNRLRQLAFATGIPLRLLSGPVVGFTIGYFLDVWLGTSPWLSLLFGVLGFAAGVKSLVDAVK